MEPLANPLIIIAESNDYSRDALQLYVQHARVQAFAHAFDPELEALLPQATGLVCRLQRMWDAAILAKAPKLRFIISPTTALNHIDEGYCQQHGIRIFSLQGAADWLAQIPSTAEHTWALLMAAIRRLLPAHQHVMDGHWQRDHWKGHNLRGKTIGLVGYGRVAKQVAGYAAAFGMQVLAFDRKQIDQPAPARQVGDIEHLLAVADIVSLHISAAGNDGFFSQELIAKCKPGAILVNTARGNIWDENAVAAAALSSHLQAVATDVLNDELTSNWENSTLVQAARVSNRVIITPHIAGATYESMKATEDYVAQLWADWWHSQQQQAL
jgi:D-3-phosphoglycerate dehydrogenase